MIWGLWVVLAHWEAERGMRVAHIPGLGLPIDGKQKTEYGARLVVVSTRVIMTVASLPCLPHRCGFYLPLSGKASALPQHTDCRYGLQYMGQRSNCRKSAKKRPTPTQTHPRKMFVACLKGIVGSAKINDFDLFLTFRYKMHIRCDN